MTQIHLEILTEVLGKDQVHTKSSQFVRVRLMAFLKLLAHVNMHENFSHAIEICWQRPFALKFWGTQLKEWNQTVDS